MLISQCISCVSPATQEPPIWFLHGTILVTLMGHRGRLDKGDSRRGRAGLGQGEGRTPHTGTHSAEGASCPLVSRSQPPCYLRCADDIKGVKWAGSAAPDPAPSQPILCPGTCLQDTLCPHKPSHRGRWGSPPEGAAGLCYPLVVCLWRVSDSSRHRATQCTLGLPVGTPRERALGPAPRAFMARVQLVERDSVAERPACRVAPAAAHWVYL